MQEGCIMFFIYCSFILPEQKFVELCKRENNLVILGTAFKKVSCLSNF